MQSDESGGGSRSSIGVLAAPPLQARDDRGLSRISHELSGIDVQVSHTQQHSPSPRVHDPVSAVDVSVVVPVYNEEQTIRSLHERLGRTLDRLGGRCEIVYVDDGSTDGSAGILRDLAGQDPRTTFVELARNCGQHAAVSAGFSVSTGSVVATIDADLQNPPEEIPRLVEALHQGYDVVGGWREDRNDPWARRFASRLINRAASAAVGVEMRDYGCMLRVYRREVVERILECSESSLFIPALANTLAHRSTEIPIDHAKRAAGQSKYRPMKLLRLAFDLLTGFSLLPIQLVSLAGVAVSAAGVGFGVFLFVRRLIVGPESEGVFTLFAVLFVFLGILILAVGLVGEYVGRIYLEVRHRPLYVIAGVHRGTTPSVADEKKRA